MNDFDIWQKAINETDLTTAVAPVIRGVMLVEDSQVEAYNKIQKLLNCPELESSHQFLYSLDPSELTEAEATKISNLYRLGLERGFISEEDDKEETEETEDGTEEKTDECDVAAQAVDQPAAVSVPAAPSLPTSAYTVLYSAMRDGQVKTGEAFSNSISTRSAKADVISKLERAGYQNISILAIEAGDPDAAGCQNSYQTTSEVPDYSVSENDILNGRHHNNHVDEDDMLNGRKHNNHVDEGDEKDEPAKDDEKKSEDKSEKKEDVKEPDEKLKDDAADDKEDGKEEDAADKDDKEEKDDELSNEKKGQLKDSYKKAFKATLQKCKFETSFSELSLEQKIDFFTELAKAWGDKEDPSKFMTDKEVEQLEKITVNKGQE